MRLVQKALTFDDVLLVPAYSEVLPRDTSLTTRLTRNITLNIPLVSAAMDTVTEARLAIAMAQEGGIGIIHKNLSADDQAKEVARVKRHEFGIVIDPVTVTPDMKVRDAIALQRQHGISGLPVVEGRKLVGIVTNRDLRFEDRLDQPLRNIMTPQDRLVTMKEGATLDEAQALMHKHRLERVLIVNDAFELRGLATVKDIVKNTEHPYACKDSQGQLRARGARQLQPGGVAVHEQHQAAAIEAIGGVVAAPAVGCADGVAFLERVGADRRGRDLAADAQHRHRIAHGVQQTRSGVGHARPRGDEHHARPAGGARVAFRRVYRGLFMTHQHMPQARLGVQSVV